MRKILKLTPTCKDYIWGGNKLRSYGKLSDTDKIAESWEISMHADGLSLSESSKNIVEEFGKEGLGKNLEDFEFFPVLVKLIDSAENLSVQVHPSDNYALENEGSYGKTEMWYVVDAEDGAGIYLGFKENTDKSQFISAVEDGSVTDLLNFYPVKRGETYFIKSGTVHAIGKGVTICEIQQNSNLTYRLYDYKRKDKDGKERPLHIDKALNVIDFSAFERKNLNVDIGRKTLIGASRYFSAYEVITDGSEIFCADERSFKGLTCLEGNGEIDGRKMTRGDTFAVSAGYGDFQIKGKMKLIMVEIRKYYIGIDLGGTFIKGGIVDDLGNIILSEMAPTESEKGPKKVIENIANLTFKMLGDANMDSSDVEGIGMGVPGMIDSKNGVVIFSNNLRWKDVRISEELCKLTGLKVKIANDANVAALGESTFGVGNSYDDCIFLTLGTGVGGGIIVGNKLVEGNKSAGAELGHMVIVDGGEQCTCGRKGCFEAYCSATALIRETKRAMKEHKDSKMWEIGDIEKVTGKTAFDYSDKDVYAKRVIDDYIEKLACGISNLANIFRPDAVIIGGGVCAQGDNLIDPLQKMVDKEIFAGDLGPACPVVISKLGNKAGTLGAAALLMEN